MTSNYLFQFEYNSIIFEVWGINAAHYSVNLSKDSISSEAVFAKSRLLTFWLVINLALQFKLKLIKYSYWVNLHYVYIRLY